MSSITHLHSLIDGKEYAVDEIEYVAPGHGNDGIVDVCYDYAQISRSMKRPSDAEKGNFSMWRYKPLLPVRIDAAVPPIPVGWTPLIEAKNLADQLGLQSLWVKDDGRNPTASFKDRASAVAIVKAQEKGAEVITTASTGNAAAALSGLCASVQQSNVIFVPKSAPSAKIAQLLVFGSTVLLVDGTYDDAFELCLKAANKYGWYNRNTGYNPYMTEGKKTVSYEICEQLEWNAPDVIFISVGDGCIIGGVHKGLKDLLALGWIDKMPRLIGVQAEGSNYLTQAWENNENVLTKPAISADTVADSISAGLPRDRLKAMAAVKETSGAYLTVTDEEILNAIPALARGCGVFAEPAGAAAYAGLLKAIETNLIDGRERVVVINTGNGLKDVQSAMQSVKQVGTKAHLVQPKMSDVEKIIQEIS